MHNDIADEDVRALLATSEHPETLRDLVALSRAKLGFFPRHKARAIEYPWILHALPAALGGAVIVDVGAGLNPLPFALADRGASVVTVDNHRTSPSFAPGEERNEWGFLDYARLDPRIASVRCAYEAWDAPVLADAVYSVSVIEHVPSAVRARWLDRFGAQVRPGGTLLLTIDLFAGSDDLWNRCEGVVIEERGAHGTLESICREIAARGFAVEVAAVHREIPDSLVDAAFLHAVRSGAPHRAAVGAESFRGGTGGSSPEP
ncbi:MAG TPA: methyltransferase domain-containing protein [Candidatus Elarobacter sp.]|nr:methyltransferase domain-containing protein [Candidatus Elarobacter sp.]